MRRYLTALALLLGVAACDDDPLAQRDPNGYEACGLLAESRKATDIVNRLGKSMQAAEAAMKSSTKAIQDSANPLFDAEAMQALEGSQSEGQNFALTDVKKLTAACEAEGFSIPEAADLGN